MLSLGLWPMYLFMHFYSILSVRFVFSFLWHRGVPRFFVGVALRTPGLRYCTNIA